MPNPPLHRLGYVALTDAAPLLAADALGFFARHGLRVSLSEEGAWAAVRDKLALGALDGAHLLGPMPIALACGLGGFAARLVPLSYQSPTDRAHRRQHSSPQSHP